MKKFFYFITIIFLLSCFSCKHDPPPPAPTPTPVPDPVSYTVAGSSGGSWDETYTRDGTENEKPRYTGVRGSVALTLYWNSARTKWEIISSTSVFDYDYRHPTATGDFPPTGDGWEDFNDDPFPALTLTANY